MAEAHYTLVSVYNKDILVVNGGRKNWTILGLENQWAYANGTAYWATVVDAGNAWAFYAHLADVSFTQLPVAKLVGATLCGNTRHMFNAEQVATTYEYYHSRGADSNATYTYDTTNKQRQLITQHHHLHVRMRDIFGLVEQLVLKGWEAELARALDEHSQNEATHATFWTYYHVADPDTKQIFFGMLREYGGLHDSWLKKEGAWAKQLQHYTPHDLTKIFELNVLVNRLQTDVDWASEKEHRTRPDTVDISYTEVLDLATELFIEAKREGKHATKMEWDDYWAQRVVSVPNGSVHSKYAADKEFISAIDRLVRSKKSVVSSMPNVAHDYWLRRYPGIEAHTSTKYEWGKTRALYGCDLTSHIHADFGMAFCENHFPHYVPTGHNANPDYVKAVLGHVSDKIPFCFDYDDFNSQHSKSSMAAVIDAWRAVFGDQITEAQHQSAVWTRDSIKNMQVRVTETGDWYTAEGTLFSGWRLTTFINTALNQVYLAKAGLAKAASKAIHNGDDVYAGMYCVADAVRVVQASRRFGVRANTTKMAIGTIAEFLRMDMRAQKPTAVQYLTRGCATFVHSRIESDAPLSYRSLVTSYATRKAELEARGGNRKWVHRMYRKQLYFAGKIFDVPLGVREKVLKYDRVCGGIAEDGKICNEVLEEVKVGEDRIDAEKYLMMFDRAIGDYTSYLKRQLPECEEAITKRMVAKSVARFFNFGYTGLATTSARRDVQATKKAMQGAWRKYREVGVIQKTKMGASDVLLLVGKLRPSLAAVLSRADNPTEWLSLLV